MATATLKCTNCKDRFPRDQMTPLPAGNFHSQDCIIEYAIREGGKKIKTKEKKDHVLRKKVFQINDVRHQHKLTQAVFNKLRRLQEFKWFSDRGLEPYCISCGKTSTDWCCGHFKTVGSQGSLRYDEMNTYLQCNRYCNMGLSGNIGGNKNSAGYLKGLELRFGKEKANKIIKYCESDKVKKWTGQELFDMRKQFNLEIKQLTKGE